MLIVHGPRDPSPNKIHGGPPQLRQINPTDSETRSPVNQIELQHNPSR